MTPKETQTMGSRHVEHERTRAYLKIQDGCNQFCTYCMIPYVNEVTKYDAEFDLVSGRYVIDAKSIMGIFSLDLSKPIDLNIHSENNIDEILAKLDEFIVK